MDCATSYLRRVRRWADTRRRSGQRGAAMIELAMALPLMVTLLAGIVEVGDALYTYSAVVAATRDGARLGIRNGDPTAIKSLVLTNVGQLRDPTLAGDVTITTSKITVSGVTTDAIKVQACHNHKLILNYPLLPLPNPMKMCASTTMRQFA